MRMVIVNRHRFVARALKDALERASDIVVIAMLDGEPNQMLARLRQLDPEMVLADAGAGGPPFVKQLRGVLPRARVVVLSAVATRAEERAFRAAGAAVYVEQTMRLDRIVGQLCNLRQAAEAREPAPNRADRPFAGDERFRRGGAGPSVGADPRGRTGSTQEYDCPKCGRVKVSASARWGRRCHYCGSDLPAAPDPGDS